MTAKNFRGPMLLNLTDQAGTGLSDMTRHWRPVAWRGMAPRWHGVAWLPGGMAWCSMGWHGQWLETQIKLDGFSTRKKVPSTDHGPKNLFRLHLTNCFRADGMEDPSRKALVMLGRDPIL